MSFIDWKKNQGSKGKKKEERVEGEISHGGSNVDRMSQVGSFRSNMSLSVADRKLEMLQAEVGRLSTITKQQAETIERLHKIVSKLQKKK
jgi:hypothetical protein